MTQTTTRPTVRGFLHKGTSTISYVVADPATAACAVIDPVLDYDAAGGRTATRSADAVITHIEEQGLKPAMILETHVHADHLSAAQYLKERLDVPVAIGWRIAEVQETFRSVYNLGDDFPTDGSQFDRLIEEGETFAIGRLQAKAIHTPGHTPACMSYVIGDAVFVGDTLFMPDGGTARCDFPGGSAATLYRSLQKLFALPGRTRVFVCHDYAPGGRDHAWETTVAAQRADNIHVGGGVGEAEFVKLREARDRTLGMPALILPSIQVNMRAGALPPAESNGVSYLKIPLNRL